MTRILVRVAFTLLLSHIVLSGGCRTGELSEQAPRDFAFPHYRRRVQSLMGGNRGMGTEGHRVGISCGEGWDEVFVGLATRLRGGGRVHRAKERERAKWERGKDRVGSKDKEGFQRGRVAKGKPRRKTDLEEEKERAERARRKRKERKAYKEVMDKAKKFKSERKRTKAHCDRMREELDVEYAEVRHLFEPLMMRDHRKRSTSKPDEYDMLLKSVSMMPRRSDADFRKAQEDEKERLGLKIPEEDVRRGKERRDRRVSEKKARRAQVSEEG